MMKVQVVKIKLVKPCKPTPLHLKTYNLSLLDELNPGMHVIRILYYPISSSSDNEQQMQIHCLEESLSEILPQFYPLAGRYVKEQHRVDCNDQGAEYKEAQVDCQLVELLINRDNDVIKPVDLDLLLPVDICAVDGPTDPMLAVQINKFKCGGVAIGVCASHRVFDSCSLGIFLSAWANASRGGAKDLICPNFDSPSFFPSEKANPLDFGVSRDYHGTRIVTKRLVFNKNAISELRRRVIATVIDAEQGRPPSRVVVVSALIAKALMKADHEKHDKSRDCLLAHAINIRERTVPPIHRDSCGSWISMAKVDFTAEELCRSDFELLLFQDLVVRLRDALREGVRDCPKILSDKDGFGRLVMIDRFVDAATSGDLKSRKVMWFTDWSKFGEYELDFGLGKLPIWVSVADVPLKDHVLMMNTTENDGIEAWVSLDESDMAYLENDEDLIMLNTTSTNTSSTPPTDHQATVAANGKS